MTVWRSLSVLLLVLANKAQASTCSDDDEELQRALALSMETTGTSEPETGHFKNVTDLNFISEANARRMRDAYYEPSGGAKAKARMFIPDRESGADGYLVSTSPALRALILGSVKCSGQATSTGWDEEIVPINLDRAKDIGPETSFLASVRSGDEAQVIAHLAAGQVSKKLTTDACILATTLYNLGMIRILRKHSPKGCNEPQLHQLGLMIKKYDNGGLRALTDYIMEAINVDKISRIEANLRSAQFGYPYIRKGILQACVLFQSDVSDRLFETSVATATGPVDGDIVSLAFELGRVDCLTLLIRHKKIVPTDDRLKVASFLDLEILTGLLSLRIELERARTTSPQLLYHWVCVSKMQENCVAAWAYYFGELLPIHSEYAALNMNMFSVPFPDARFPTLALAIDAGAALGQQPSPIPEPWLELAYHLSPFFCYLPQSALRTMAVEMGTGPQPGTRVLLVWFIRSALQLFRKEIPQRRLKMAALTLARIEAGEGRKPARTPLAITDRP